VATAAGSLALPYPASTDVPDGPAAFLALANRVQASLGRDSGWLDLPRTDGNPHSSQSAVVAKYRRVGGSCTVVFSFADTYHYTGDAIVVVGVLPAGFRSDQDMNFVAAYDYSSGPVITTPQRAAVYGSGLVQMIYVTTGSTVGFYGSATFPVTLS